MWYEYDFAFDGNDFYNIMYQQYYGAIRSIISKLEGLTSNLNLDLEYKTNYNLTQNSTSNWADVAFTFL